MKNVSLLTLMLFLLLVWIMYGSDMELERYEDENITLVATEKLLKWIKVMKSFCYLSLSLP